MKKLNFSLTVSAENFTRAEIRKGFESCLTGLLAELQHEHLARNFDELEHPSKEFQKALNANESHWPYIRMVNCDRKSVIRKPQIEMSQVGLND